MFSEAFFNRYNGILYSILYTQGIFNVQSKSRALMYKNYISKYCIYAQISRYIRIKFAKCIKYI